MPDAITPRAEANTPLRWNELKRKPHRKTKQYTESLGDHSVRSSSVEAFHKLTMAYPKTTAKRRQELKSIRKQL